MTAQSELLGYAKYVPNMRLYFPYGSSSIYVITAVDQDAQTVTFAPPYDREDETTETMADLESVDVRVLA